jgi:choline-sulfatase
MRILIIDIDTLRPDHMSCYGYKRNTTPAIDAVAAEGVVFDRYYCPNAPCLPSRASFITGQYGVRTGVVGHGGTAADLRPQGRDRHFTDDYSCFGLFASAKRAGLHTASVSTFAERHSSWWFNAGLNECYNLGTGGGEIAGDVTPVALDWLDRRGTDDNWLLHVHYWDPHTPYRAPAEFGNPFEDTPLPDDWIDEDVFAQHLLHVGPHGANEIGMFDDSHPADLPRHPGSIKTLGEVKRFIDNYDCGIRYADDNIALLFERLKSLGIWDDTAVIITSDHGENIGELGLYAEHGTADDVTCHIPMIVKWPGGAKGVRAGGFRDNTDLVPTLRELLGLDPRPKGYIYDGVSFADIIRGVEGAERKGRDSVVLTQCAHVCQRSARFGDWVYIRTVHGGYHLFPREMLFNVAEDPHERRNLADERPDICAQGAKIILDWNESVMKTSRYETDPMWTVMREGGPEHARGELRRYMERLRGTPREYGIAELEKMYPGEP